MRYIASILAILMLGAASPSSRPTPNVAAEIADLWSNDSAKRAGAVEMMKHTISTEPRTGVTEIFKSRVLDIELPHWWNPNHQYDADFAAIALACINGQPDSTDRVQYFLEVRIHSLLNAGRNLEALAAAKSYFNVCAVENTLKAIGLLGDCLAAAYPSDPALARRFKLQMLGVSAGNNVLSAIAVDASVYDQSGFAMIRNHDWRDLASANLRLLQDHPQQAKEIFDRLASSSTDAVRPAGQEGLLRLQKAVNPLAASSDTNYRPTELK